MEGCSVMNYTLRYSFDLETIYMVHMSALSVSSALTAASSYIEKEHPGLALGDIKAISIVEEGEA